MHKELMSKAIRAAASARTLLAVGDADGASNRAYYAMFDAARAALWVSGVNAGKTHRGILNAFHEQLIKTEKLPVEMGRLLKRAETFRYIADYEGDTIDLLDAKDMVDCAENFVSVLMAQFMPD